MSGQPLTIDKSGLVTSIGDKPLKTIEVYFDPNGMKGGKIGCWRARLASNTGIHDAGIDSDNAVNNLLKVIKSFGGSDNKLDYQIKNI